ncbi:diadenylate cyclase CdaA [Myxococcota bacterium]
MFDAILEYLGTRAASGLARDALDLAVVYYVIYRVLLLLRGTRAMQIGVGLVIVLGLYLLAHALHLVTVLSILGSLISSFILVVVVVFQNDIRRGLMRVGSRWVGSWGHAMESRVIDEVVAAVTELARHRTGALIAFEQDANLDEFVGIHKGRLLDAAVSSELLVSLFLPEAMNKLHDGAVVIRNLRIAKAGVFFPLHEGRVLDQSFGSRHRAALGITEETDAVVVAVSEERGTISLCFAGNIASNLDEAKLHTALEASFSPKGRKKRRRAQTSPRLSSVNPSPVPAAPAERAEDPAEMAPVPVPADGAAKPAPRAAETEARPGSGGEAPTPLRPRPAWEESAGQTPPNSTATDSRTAVAGEASAPLRPRPVPEEGATPAARTPDASVAEAGVVGASLEAPTPLRPRPGPDELPAPATQVGRPPAASPVEAGAASLDPPVPLRPRSGPDESPAPATQVGRPPAASPVEAGAASLDPPVPLRPRSGPDEVAAPAIRTPATAMVRSAEARTVPRLGENQGQVSVDEETPTGHRGEE